MKLNKIIFYLFSFVLGCGVLSAQNITITGEVLDDNNVPIPGATIMEQGTKNGVVTDFEGKYEIAAAPESSLVFSYLGYTTITVAINNKTVINVTLQPELATLDDVVVVGYGTQKKSVVTGAISSVKASDIENLPVTRVEQTLQGRASGLTIASNSGQPGSSSTIRVRGLTSFGSTQPLWVVDGVIVDAGGIGYLNQSDIASIEVLKDAASQAIYGTRAAAGVILVTTKKGKSGKLSINYNGYVGVSGPAKKLDLLNASQYAAIRNESMINAGEAPMFTDPDSYGNGTNWQNTIFNDSAMREGHEISLSGGNDKSTFYLSFGYLDQEGIVASDISKYNRKNIRINSNHKFTDRITIGQNLGYSHERSQGLGNTNSEFGGPLSSAINLEPITPAVVTDPNVANQAPYVDQPVMRDANGNPYGISTLTAQELSNPLAYIQTRLGNFGWSDNFVGNAFVELKLLEGLKFRSTLGGKLSYWGNDNFTPEYYLNASTVVNQNSLSTSKNKGFGWNLENTASYTKDINEHSFNILLGQGVYVDNITDGSTVTYFDIPYDNFQDAAFPGSHPTDDITSSAYRAVEHRIVSVFARVNYNYKEKYLFSGIIRRDGSSRFGANKKFGNFPSMSLGWVVSKENFWKENEIVNTLKFKGGYGVVGSDSIRDFAFLSSIGTGRNYTYGNEGVVIGYSPNAPSNPDLHWEETSQANIGFESRLLNNFSFTFEWFKKKTTDILQTQPIPNYLGSIGDPVANIGSMENTGFEMELGWVKSYEDLKFSVHGNASYLKNKVTELGKVDYINGPGFQNMGSITRTEAGHAYNEFYGYETQGIFQNQAEVDAYTTETGDLIQPNAQPGDFRFVDLNGDGRISEDDRTYIGNPTPTWTYGLTFNVSYKAFDLLVFGQGVAGNKIFQGLRRLDINNANYLTSVYNRWTEQGSTNSYPRLVNGDPNNNFSRFTKFYLEDGDYFRIKTIQLGYTLPKSITEKALIKRLRVYVTGENLLTFTKYSGYDPEVGGGTLSIDRGQYPQARSYMVGVNVDF